METVFVSAELPDDVRARLEARFHLVDVPEGTSSGLAAYGDPVGWYLDGDTEVDDAVLAQLPALRVVANNGVGYDGIDVAAATRAGVVVTNTPGVVDDAVAELALGLILALGRGMPAADRHIRDGSWRLGPAPLTAEVHRSTLGVVGMGRIGRRLAELVRPLGMPVLYHSRSQHPDVEERGLATRVPLDELLRRSDFVSLHLPLTEATAAVFGPAEFAAMKPTAYLVNVARGGVVDTAALVAALDRGEIAGAGLDVFDEEPLPDGHPILSAPGVILQPHSGTATHQTRRAMVELAIANLEAVLSAERPPSALNWTEVPARRPASPAHTPKETA